MNPPSVVRHGVLAAVLLVLAQAAADAQTPVTKPPPRLPPNASQTSQHSGRRRLRHAGIERLAGNWARRCCRTWAATAARCGTRSAAARAAARPKPPASGADCTRPPAGGAAGKPEGANAAWRRRGRRQAASPSTATRTPTGRARRDRPRLLVASPTQPGEWPIEARRLRRDRRQRRHRGDEVRRRGRDRQLGDALRRHPLAGRHRRRRAPPRRHAPGERPPDERHPFGHGKELYFWSLIVAVLMFGVGGGVSIYEGILRLLDPSRWRTPAGATRFSPQRRSSRARAWRSRFASSSEHRRRAVLGVAQDEQGPDALHRDGRGQRSARRPRRGSRRHLRQPQLGLPAFDAGASIVIGLLLCAVSTLLIVQARKLLVGEAVDIGMAEAIRAIAQGEPSVHRAGWPLTMHLGPDECCSRSTRSS